MGTFSRTWDLIGQSFSVLRKDKKLVVFPLLSTLSALAIAAAYGIPLFRLGVTRPAVYGWLFLWYCTNYFVIIFFNCALAACAQTRFSGGEPTLSAGMSRAADNLGRILLWAIVASTVGLLLRIIADRSRWLGKIVSSLLGIAWTLATFLIVPVLVFEDLGVFSSIKRSGELFRKTWGQQISGGFSLGLPFLVLSIPGVLLAMLGMRIHPLGLAAAVVYFMMLATVMSAVKGIFAVALYRFVTDGEAPAGFSPVTLNGAFVNLQKR